MNSIRSVGLWYRLRVRLVYAAIFLLLAPAAFADRVILVPTGSKILYRTVRAEWMFEPGREHRYDAFLGLGITKDIEAEFILEKFDPRAALGSVNLSYNYLPPITDVAPGLSLGVKDALNRTEDGRLVYLAATLYRSVDVEAAGSAPFELTLGGGIGTHRSGLFVGVELPFTWRLRGIAEHDLHRVTAGLEYQAFEGFAVRWLFRDRQNLWSLRYTVRF